MAALDFPAAPAVNDQYSSGANLWVWNGVAWELRSINNPVWFPANTGFGMTVLSGATSSMQFVALGPGTQQVSISMNPNSGGTKATLSLRVRGPTTDSLLKIDDSLGVNGLIFNTFTVWNAGNGGAGSGLDADLLDGQHGSFYQSASNLNAGTVADARFSSRQTTTPTVTANAGAFTTVSCEVNYQRVGDSIWFDVTITDTTNGTAAGWINVPMPFTAIKECVAVGRQAAVGGKEVQGIIAASSTSMTVLLYDNTYPGATGERITLSGRAFVN